MAELSAALPHLRCLVLLFNNSAQQFESRHLAAISTHLTHLTHLTLQANFHPDACTFAMLAPLSNLTHLSIRPSDATTGLTDAHVASLAYLPQLAHLDFPGHARAFTGATLMCLAALPALATLHITSIKPQHVDYTLALPTLAAVQALCRRPASAPALDLELGVPDAAFAAALLRAGASSNISSSSSTASCAGLSRLAVSIREAVSSQDLAALAAAPGASQQLAAMDLEFRGAPTPEDIALLAQFSSLQRLVVTCKCVRAPSSQLDLRPWFNLQQLTHLHLHINPAWRLPLTPRDLTAMAAAWPKLERLHLRLSAADTSSHALAELWRFSKLRSLSLQWLGQLGPEPRMCGLRRRSSMDAYQLNMQCLPSSLEELSLTSINAVRLVVPLPVAADAAGPAENSCFPVFQQQVVQQKQLGLPLTKLHSLALDGNFGLCDELLVRMLGQLPALQSLSLVLAGRQTLTASGLAACCCSQALSTLLVSDYREAPLSLDQSCVAGLRGCARLRHLKLSTPDIVHAELRPEMFSSFRKLRRLDLVGCQEQAASSLGAALPFCCMKYKPEWGESSSSSNSSNGGAQQGQVAGLAPLDQPAAVPVIAVAAT
jgi:hypothetical protein